MLPPQVLSRAAAARGESSGVVRSDSTGPAGVWGGKEGSVCVGGGGGGGSVWREGRGVCIYVGGRGVCVCVRGEC